MKRSTLAERHCPVARAAEQLVDAWSFVILRELFLATPVAKLDEVRDVLR